MNAQPVGLGRRAGALVVDAVVIAALTLPVGQLLGRLWLALGLMQAGSIDTNAGAIAVLLVDYLGTAWIYVLLEGAAGFGIGKLLWGLRIRKADGGPAGLLRRVFRAVLKILPSLAIVPFFGMEDLALAIPCFALGLAFLAGYFLVLGRKRQALHDLLPGTAIYKAD